MSKLVCFRGALHLEKWSRNQLNHPLIQLRTIFLGSRTLAGNKPLNETKKQSTIKLENYPPELIRNFSIIAHIDHGKSTLSDRLLQLTGTIPQDLEVEQYLDKLDVERERGITVKAQTVSLIHTYQDTRYLLNLIDTPGHSDFTFEVYRSLVACEGAVLLIDSCSGVQAQTVAHFNHALLSDKAVLPVLNKIDMKNANPEKVLIQLKKLFSMDPEEIYKISARFGTGVGDLLDAIVHRIPPPTSSLDKPLKAFLFDSWHDSNRGVMILIRIIDGSVKTNDKIVSCTTKKSYEVKSCGILHPNEVETNELNAGQVGYIFLNIRDTKELKLGDMFIHNENLFNEEIIIPEIPKMKPMVFAGLFPEDISKTSGLKKAIEKLTLNDASVEVTLDNSPALGAGFRLGFLGLLHMEVFSQRLEEEFDAPCVTTIPSVPYRVKIKGAKNIKSYGCDIVKVTNPIKLPDINIIEKYYEPMILATIITPNEYMSTINHICMERRAEQRNAVYIDQNNMMLQFKIPLNEVVIDFYEELKLISSGYASFDYEDLGFEETKLVKLEFLLNKKPIEELTLLVQKTRAPCIAKQICVKLKQNIPKQQFKVIIQAAIGSKILCRENIDAHGKDVIQKLKYGGDESRKQKLLKRQQEGKERLRMLGDIQIPKSAFIKILRK